MKVKALGDHEQKPVQMDGATQTRMRMLVGPEDGAKNFHMRHFEVAPGGHTPHHKHDYEHEILILKGEGVARSEQGDRPVKPGDVLFVPPNEMHQFVNNSAAPLEFICLIPAPMDCSR
ncbi:MAG: cupin domain-containing protein [Phycisphaerae bacterium]|nr:MAG: cupin domain-containing protein [Planctomycetota bacterium]KAB2945568.1 MAG: cupin domain-containing protein [Phycisphaerae bacterium]MBE7456920.1 cupin domain-containing protein [Planctomycetia bacterium]MCK6466259.1 cupin domain-containing protein [Phycisphaerae bacterium]MCL4720008.1 cupin domain-containing protein [Phycisphaerae bacterium]